MTRAALRPRAASVAAACLIAAALQAALPALEPAWLPSTASAHAELVSSSPGSGERLASPPAEARLVFAEPIDARYSGLDVVDAQGQALAIGPGAPDPRDGRVLVAAIPAGALAGDGIYEIRWHTLSATDGHAARGSVSFAIGAAGSVPGPASGTGGDDAAGHSAAIAVVEVPARVLAYGGSMLALGLAVVSAVALLPAARGESGQLAATSPAPASRRKRSKRTPVEHWRVDAVLRAIPLAAAGALVAGSIGCLVLVMVGFASLPVPAGSADLVTFVTGTHSAVLLSVRVGVGIVGALVIAVVWRRAPGVARTFVPVALAGLLGLILTAAGSHAAAYDSPVPVAVDVVHLAAASIWLSGVALLAGLTDFGRASRVEPDALRRIVPRFSALALASVATIALTGAYADWVLTRDPISIRSTYQAQLVAKTAFFVAALAIGALNLLDGGRSRQWLGGLSRRLVLELGLAAGVVTMAAVVTTGSPAALARPVSLEPTGGQAVATDRLTLAVVPGRPGPNRFVAAGIAGSDAILVLRQLDLNGGTSRTPMRPDPGSPGVVVADAVLPAATRWEATVIGADTPDGASERSRRSFTFALDATTIAAGRALPPIDPTDVVAVLLVGLAAAGLGFSFAGGVLPRTTRDASRVSIAGASVVAIVLGVGILLGRPPV